MKKFITNFTTTIGNQKYNKKKTTKKAKEHTKLFINLQYFFHIFCGGKKWNAQLFTNLQFYQL